MPPKYILLLLLINNILGENEEQYYLKIKYKEYQIQLEDNETVNKIKSKFPLTITMTNLNSNEVYYYFTGESFPTNTKSVGTINQGDIYLYQSNCLVLFYKTFSTSYSYTKIGKVIAPNGLDTLIGSDKTVEVQWFIKQIPKETSLPESKTDDVPKDSSSNKIDTTQTSEKTSDTTTTSINKDNDNDFDYFGYQSFIKLRLNYIALLFLAFII